MKFARDLANSYDQSKLIRPLFCPKDEDQSVNRKEKRAGKRAAIPVTSPIKERTKKRGTVSSSPATVRKTKRSNTLVDKSVERSRKGKKLWCRIGGEVKHYNLVSNKL